MLKVKFCTGCKNEKPVQEFGPRLNGFQSRCRPCKREYDNHWNRKRSPASKKKRKQQKKALRRLTVQFIFDYLRDHPCIDCGESDPIVLEFDHYRGKKLFNIADGASRSLDRTKVEIKKCRVLCANCHRRRTAKQLKWYKGII